MSLAIAVSLNDEASRTDSRRSVVTEPKTYTLDVPGAVLTYDVRSNDSSTEPVLLLIGSPMGAAGFGTLAGHFAGRTVVTYDPRGVERSQRTDYATESTPDEHADDLRRLITALDAGPVEIFANSGGAVNALALVARHPEQVRTLVAHEPPAAQVLPDREYALAACLDIHETYQRSGLGPGMAKFIMLASHKGPIAADLNQSMLRQCLQSLRPPFNVFVCGSPGLVETGTSAVVGVGFRPRGCMRRPSPASKNSAFERLTIGCGG
jgi:pimeloyl-ACP methyl ester carboxylesterase